MVKKTESEGGELCSLAFNWACGACWGISQRDIPSWPLVCAVIR